MKYFLAEACQNTFILFDCLRMAQLGKEFLQIAHQCLKKEERDDALILVDGRIDGTSFSAQFVVLGCDGQLAEFCGNGARAAAAYLFAHHPFFKTIFLRTHRGLLPLAQHGRNIYSVKFPPARFEWNEKFISNPERLRKLYPFEYVETLEPHLIIKKVMSDEELLSIGRKLNQQTDLFPFGINVNAWHELKKGEIYVQTYERGVQRLTRSCGTGSAACAGFYQGKGTVLVSTPGGSLEIIFHNNEVELCGEGFIQLT